MCLQTYSAEGSAKMEDFMEEAKGMDLHRQFLSLPPVELSVLFFHLKQETNKKMPLSNNNNNKIKNKK